MNFNDAVNGHFPGKSIEVSMLLLATILGMLQLAVAARAGNSQRGLKWNVGPRDEEGPPIGKVAARRERARYLVGRVAFVPLYALLARHRDSRKAKS